MELNKKIKKVMCRLIYVFGIIALLLLPLGRAAAQADEAAQLALNIEKLNQLRQILRNMYRGYTILTQGYNRVKELTSSGFQLHQLFIDGLLQVNPLVKNDYRIIEIVNGQIRLTKEYQSAFNYFKGSGRFNSGQIDYMSAVYGRLIHESLKGLDELLMVVTTGKVRMNDAERLSTIDRIHADMESRLSFLRTFNRHTLIFDEQRHQELQQTQNLRKLNK